MEGLSPISARSLYGLPELGAGASGVDPLRAFSSSGPGETSKITLPPDGGAAEPGRSVGPAFSEILGHFLHQVDQTQHRADDAVESLALGEPVDVHQVMLALNEASNALQMTLQVRGRILEAYQELMRTQF